MANLDLNFSSNDYSIVGNISSTAFLTIGTYIRLSVHDELDNIVSTSSGEAIFYSTLDNTSFNIQIPANVSNVSTRAISKSTSDFEIYQNTNDDNIYIKPNEILQSYGLSEGNYTLKLEFLKQYQPNIDSGENDYFIIKEISPTRLEVRLKLLDNNITEEGLNATDGSNWLNDFLSTLGTVVDNNYTHGFKHVLYVGNGLNIPIVNVTFDKGKDGIDNQSIILKLYDRLPNNINKLRIVTIEEELLISQTQEVLYLSDEELIQPGRGLYVDNSYNLEGTTISSQTFENLDDLTGSLSQQVFDNITTGSFFDYKNLNTNFNLYSNHVVLGSAKRKLENFKNKVTTIQSYYSDISSSLSVTGVAPDNDSETVVQLRKGLFNKIRDEVKTFTPYEKFLYYDAQTTSTASAPGIKNYASFQAVHLATQDSTLNGHDGFDVVYKHTTDASDFTFLDLFTDTYHAHKKPFFNHSSSIYLQFLMKGGNAEEVFSDGLTWENSNLTNNGLVNTPLPPSTHYKEEVETPVITGSEYRRFIYHTSMSYFIPNETVNFDLGDADFTAADIQVEVLSGSIKTGSNAITDTSGLYQDLLTAFTGSSDGMEAVDNPSFNGSVMPAGELFRIYFKATGGTASSPLTSSLITDVKVTLESPVDILPFDNLYHTSSTKWQNWYDDSYASASAYDEENIHSLENNLPDYIQQSSQYNDLKKFLSLIGENADLLRNYIDNFSSFHNRSYDSFDSVPGNLMPILLDNMGWEALQPFSGSIANYYGNFLSSKTSVKEVEENTWRKTLNNLISLYKSKGTKNSIRSLLNIYGYPPDVLTINEFGGSTQPQNDIPISPSTPLIGTTNNDTNLEQSRDNVSYYSKPRKLVHYRFNNQTDRILNTDWWMNNADANAVEFVYKHKTTSNTQTILISSGSGATGATGTVTIVSSTGSQFDGDTVILSSSDGTGKTYIFDDDGDGATGTVDGSSRIRVQIQNLSGSGQIANELSKSIASSNGHNGKINITDEQYFSSSNAPFYTSDSQSFALSNVGILNLTQDTFGDEGNLIITSSVSSSFLTVSGFGSGTDSQNIWDLRLVPSASSNRFYKFELRLNNSNNSSGSISTNSTSMATSFVTMSNGSLWNVMLQRLSSSISGSGTNQYQLAAASQIGHSIDTLSFVSMSVSGGLEQDSNYFANKSWVSIGSRNSDTASNLVIGSTMSGSLAEFRSWKSALSMSKFRLHTLNKFSTVGNDIDAHTDDLIYHFKLNENYNSSSISSSAQTTISILDSNPNGPNTNPTDYTFTKPSGIVTGSALYGFDIIQLNSISIQDSTQNLRNDNKIIIKPDISFNNNLNPFTPSVKRPHTRKSRVNRVNSTKLEINNSPQDFVNNFILEKIQRFNLEKKYGNPQNIYSSSHTDLEDFRKKFFNKYEISVDTNKFIKVHENIFNKSIIDGIEKLIPARSTLTGKNKLVGVTIKPTILEKSKIKYQKHSLEVNPNLATGSILITSNTNHKSGFSITETYNQPKSGSISINNTITKEALYQLPKSGSLSIENVITKEFSYDRPKSGSVLINNTITKEISLESPKSSSLSIENVITKEFSYDRPKSGSVSVVDNITKNILYTLPKSGSTSVNDIITKDVSYILPKSGSTSINDYISKEISYELPKSGSFSIPDDYISKDVSYVLPKSASISIFSSYISASSDIVLPVSGTNNYFSTNNTKKFVNLHNSWGTSNSNTHFVNLAEKIIPTKTSSSLSIDFIQSASFGSTITLTSFDGTTELTKKYFVTTASSAKNGDFSANSSSVLVLTGSGTTIGAGSSSQAGNFLAAVTSSNGHDTSFAVTQKPTTSGQVTIKHSFAGPKGNSFSASYGNNFSSSTNKNILSHNFDVGSIFITSSYNRDHREKRQHFIMIGDIEIYSASKANETDFSNFRHFHNRQNITDNFNEDITYESFIHGNPGLQTGRAIGKTRYFYTASDGTITLPSNHVRKFSQPFVDRMYQGTQNTDPGFMNISDYTDLATSSFYRVKVTGGENQIIVKSGQPTKDNDDKIIY